MLLHMRMQSATLAKRGVVPEDRKPGEGTILRELYDRFFPPLTVVRVTRGDWDQLNQLRDTYGLDIHRYRRGHYWLVGEFINEKPYYRDYLAERVDNHKR